MPAREPPEPFPVRFYLVAMIFIVFDIEIVFLYPYAVIHQGARRLRAGRDDRLLGPRVRHVRVPHRQPRPRLGSRLRRERPVADGVGGAPGPDDHPPGRPRGPRRRRGRPPDALEMTRASRASTTTSSPARSRLVRWARRMSLMPATFGLACCAIEMMGTGGAHDDIARFGMETFRASPRQADLMIVAGRVRQKMAPVLRQVYDQMMEPKWVLRMGVCASSGGMFNNYALVQGVHQIVPVASLRPGLPARARDAASTPSTPSTRRSATGRSCAAGPRPVCGRPAHGRPSATARPGRCLKHAGQMISWRVAKTTSSEVPEGARGCLEKADDAGAEAAERCAKDPTNPRSSPSPGGRGETTVPHPPREALADPGPGPARRPGPGSCASTSPPSTTWPTPAVRVLPEGRLRPSASRSWSLLI